MATHNSVRHQRKLSTTLSFFIVGLGIVFALIVGLQLVISDQSPLKFGEKTWLTFIATAVGVFTWFGTSLVSIRNSIKQHTITTLLQMRLSSTYMEHANKVASALSICRKIARPPFKHPCPKEILNSFLLEDGSIDPKGELSLRYVLNYFEFLAIGVARGDFDERMLYDSLSSIFENNIAMTRSWIEQKRQADSDIYCHVAWLHDRWCPDALRLLERVAKPQRKLPF